MTQLISFLQTSVAYIVPMVILLGLLIFIHELGHFLVAKYFKVRVEVFSLGFGPKLFKFKRGDTTYAVSAIPLGGYVKMFGDDPTAAVPEDMKSISFIYKPVGQRIWIVLAGPLMNFFFAIAIFAVVAVIGEPLLAPKAGDIKADTPAYAAGFRSGDVVQKVNGQEIKTWDQLKEAVEDGGGREVTFDVVREGTQETAQVKTVPSTVRNKEVLSWKKQVGEIDGLSFSSLASVVGVWDPQSPAAKAGLKTGDIVTAINGEKVERWRDLENMIAKHAGSGQLKITVDRDKIIASNPVRKQMQPVPPPSEPASTLELTLDSTAAQGKTGAEALKALGLEFPETYLAGFDSTSPAKEAGLQEGDKIVSIDNQNVTTFDEISKIVRAFPVGTEAEGKKLQIGVLRDGQRVDVSVQPHFKERMNQQGREEARFEIGIKPMIIDAIPASVEVSTSNPVAALSRGWDQTMKWTSLTVLSFVRLFQAEVSPKNIGGFISIGQMAKRSWQVGMAQFFNIMAIISINLFILNLLPVPVLDGGHLVFFTIEALRGAPLSMRKLEIAQQVGLILLLGLMVFALFNDVTRLFN